MVGFMARFRWLRAACCIQTALIALSFVVYGESVAASETAQGSISLSGVVYIGDLPTMVSAEHGIFQRHGLDINLTRRASGKENLRALRNGETDIALMATAPLVLDRLQSPSTGKANDPLIIASLAFSSRLNHVATLASNGIASPSDLTGQRIGLMQGTNAEVLWWLYTVFNRIEPDSARVVDMPITELPEALVAGDVDAAVLWEPWTSRLNAQIGSELVLLPGSDTYIEHWILVTTRGLLQQHPEVMHNLIAAYRDAIAFIETSPDQAFDLYSEQTGLEAHAFRTQQDLPVFGLSLNWSLLSTLMETIHWARQSVDLKNDGTPNPLSWIEPGPLRDVMPLAVGLPALPASDRTAPP